MTFPGVFPGVGSFPCMCRSVGLSASKGRAAWVHAGGTHAPLGVLASRCQEGLAGEQAKRFGSQVLVWPGTYPGEGGGLSGGHQRHQEAQAVQRRGELGCRCKGGTKKQAQEE